MPASYPTSIKSFTTKQDNVDDVLAAHINDLQDEVVAIETALGVGKATSYVNHTFTADQSYRSIAVSTGIPVDNTIPQSTEGAEYTQLTTSHTPKKTTNILEIEVIVQAKLPAGNGSGFIIALFKDSETDARAVTCAHHGTDSNGSAQVLKIMYRMTAGTTSAISFKVRVSVAGSTANAEVNSGRSSETLGNKITSNLLVREFNA